MQSIADNLHALRKRIADAALTAGREPGEVKLLAVAKTFDVAAVREAAQAGQVSFGENYLQEALPKLAAMPQLDWHFIGALQSNKTKGVAQQFDWLHTLASVKVGRRLHEQRQGQGAPLNCLIQVNVSAQATKSGVAVDELSGLVEGLLGFERVALRGLMAIPAKVGAEAEQRRAFAKLRELRDSIQARFNLAGFTELSMGMSHDFEAAIKEGATWVRVGAGIFGPRASLAPLVCAASSGA